MLKHINIFWKLSATFIVIILLFIIALDNIEKVVLDGNSFTQNYLHVTLIISAIVMISCGVAWLFIILFIKKPINSLADGMNRLAEKEFDFRLDEKGEDIFGSLASSFNDMATMLSSSLTELQKSRDYLSTILNSSADIIITVNSSGIIRTFNVGAELNLGHKEIDLIGKPIESLFADPNERIVVARILKNSDNVMNYQTQFVTNEGKVRDVLLTLSRLRNSTGAVIGAIGIGKDITREKRLQKKLIQSQRYAAIGEVFTGIQHSMKNMLNACKGGAYMVRTGLAKDDRFMLEEGWEMVQEGITRLSDMSVDMLKYVREWKPRVNQVDVVQVLTEIDHIMKQTANDKGVKFHLNVTKGLPTIICDPKMIHSAIMDIVSNALDACNWKDYDEDVVPEIVVKAFLADDDENLIIEIKDNGCGMTEDVKANIFNPFFSTKSKAGTGLGLSITSRIISAHNGNIEVKSEPDQGAIFRISLPLIGTDGNKENYDGKESSGSR